MSPTPLSGAYRRMWRASKLKQAVAHRHAEFNLAVTGGRFTPRNRDLPAPEHPGALIRQWRRADQRVL